MSLINIMKMLEYVSSLVHIYSFPADKIQKLPTNFGSIKCVWYFTDKKINFKCSITENSRQTAYLLL